MRHSKPTSFLREKELRLPVSSLLACTFSLFATACSTPEEYRINASNQDGSIVRRDKENTEVPESQKDGYMRIISDLRWDQLTSAEEWIARFPKCLFEGYDKGSTDFLDKVSNRYFAKEYLTKDGWKHESEVMGYEFTKIRRNDNYWKGEDRFCEDFAPASIPMTITEVDFDRNSGTQSGTMATEVTIEFSDQSQSRAIKAALSQKYKLTYNDDFNERYCSKYTCWRLGDINSAGDIYAYPTPYTISILDRVSLNSSDL